MNSKIKDIVAHMPDHQVSEHFHKLSGTVAALAREIGVRTERSNASIAYANIANRTATELSRLARLYPSEIEGAAWCARNIFERNLVLRYISRRSENFNRWMGQFAGDEKQIIEGFLTLSADSNLPERKVLQDRLDAIKTITTKHNIQTSGPFNIKAIADEEGLSDEYVGLYKLFSKYVHPSSWLVNASSESVQSKEYVNIFLIYAQLHAGDSCTRIDEWLAANPRPQI